MRSKRIGILLVQETHLTEERKCDIEKAFPRRLKVFSSPHPTNPTAAGGVAVVLNRQLANIHDVKTKVIIPGRAILLKTNWHRGETITVLNVYAPNVTSSDGKDNAEFWDKIREFFAEGRNRTWRPQLMAGDCNMVEDPIDRLPMRSDPEEAADALDSLKMTLRLRDGWRTTFPDEKNYTFSRSNSQSRLDRIYVTERIMCEARQWEIAQTGIEGADHDLVSVQVAHENAPHLGKGRWTMPNCMMKHRDFKAFAKVKGLSALEELDSLHQRSEDKNPQRTLATYIEEIQTEAKRIEKTLITPTQQENARLRKRLKQIQSDQSLPSDQKCEQIHDTKEKLKSIDIAEHNRLRRHVAAHDRLEGETICKYWTNVNKVKKPRELLYALEKPTPAPLPAQSTAASQSMPEYEKHSRKMAEIARDYHENLQNLGMNTNTTVREEKITKILDDLPITLDAGAQDKLSQPMTEGEILAALRKSKNGSSPGINGITYEFWKSMADRYEQERKQQALNPFNVVKLLTAAYNDIIAYGVDPTTKFSEGWMCPIYKKGDRNKISNYRPITLLNTDYKIFTKALAVRLAETCINIIHPNQAGFMPGRQISEQTRLIRMVMDYAEYYNENGMIVALDQEKAYDKIAHDYLSRTLAAFKFPPQMISTVESLYSSAETRVMINGHLSTPFKVTRGVRQGDPMSCLLFNIAIEPLANAIRRSNLKGYEIPGVNEKLITNLFADDTTVFLSDDDEFESLQQILDDWCIAARAVFNIAKTQIIPIGNKQYRINIAQTRQSRANRRQIPDNIHIALDHEAVRILGAWYGYDNNGGAAWSSQLEKIDAALENWDQSNPTMDGRKKIIQMIVGGMTQYLAQAQGMPAEIEKKLTKRIRQFLWAEKTQSPVNYETLLAAVDTGGQAALDLAARNLAIEVMWLKSYLNISNDRAIWAKVADAIIAGPKVPITGAPNVVPANQRNVDHKIKENIFLQSWETKITALPEPLKRMLKAAKEIGLRTEGIAFSTEILRERPIWLHSEAAPKIRMMNHSEAAWCLKNKHHTRTVGDMQDLAELVENTEHLPTDECECPKCLDIEEKTGCAHPHRCALKAQELLNTLPQKWDPRRLQPSNLETEPTVDDGFVEIDARLTTKGTLADIFRVFTKGEKCNDLPPPKLQNRNIPEQPAIRIAVSGRTAQLGCTNEKAGGGITTADADQSLDTMVQAPRDIESSNTAGELEAIKTSLESLPQNQELQIITETKSTADILLKSIQNFENRGFIGVRNRSILQKILEGVRKRTARTLIKHGDDEDLEEKRMLRKAAGIAKEGTHLEGPNPNPEKCERTLRQTGAKLVNMTQALAYKAIREKKEETYTGRRRTSENVKRIQDDIQQKFGFRPSRKAIWRAIRHKDFSRESRYFLWMLIHDAYMVGSNWQRPSYSPEYQARATCKKCNKLESMEHILTDCSSNGQTRIWELARGILTKKGITIAKPSLGFILGCGLPNLLPNGNGKNDKGKERLLRIILSESARLIWLVRNERVLNDRDELSNIEISNRWLKMINRRLQLDIDMTHPKFELKALSKSLVTETWKGLLQNEGSLGENWTNGKNEVLVGMPP